MRSACHRVSIVSPGQAGNRQAVQKASTSSGSPGRCPPRSYRAEFPDKSCDFLLSAVRLGDANFMRLGTGWPATA